MSRNRSKFALGCRILGGVAFSAMFLFGQTSQSRIGLPQDWTHKHLIFSNPGSIVDALNNGTPGSLDRWNRITVDTRYRLQQVKRNSVSLGGLKLIDGGQEPELGALSQKDSFGARAAKKPGPPPPTSSLTGDWSMNLGSGAKVGAGMYPAKFNFSAGSASCANDFVMFNTSASGGSGQATIAAFNNLYPGCGGTVPSTYWSYNTGTNATAVVSPVFSFSGSQIAFVQNVAGKASLVLLRWKASEGTSATSPVSPTSINTCTSTTGACSTEAGNYVTCKAGTTSCQLSLQFSGTTTPANTNSAPFYDYNSDTLYVGDDSGKLHKFTTVFNGMPAETTATWPVTLGTTKVTAPVYDLTSNKVFAGDAGGIVYSVTPSGVKITSGLVATGVGLVGGPLVDSSAGTVYFFVARDNSGGNFQTAVVRFATGFAANDTGTPLVLNGKGSSGIMYSGMFDNQYFSSGVGSLYVCDPIDLNTPRLTRISIAAGGAMAANPGPTVTSSTAVCSPVGEVLSVDAQTTTTGISNIGTSLPVASGTGFAINDFIQIDLEIMKITAIGGGGTPFTVTRAQLGTTQVAHSNGATVQDIHDRIFLSVSANGSGTNCTGACLYSYDVTSGAAISSGTAASAGIAAAGGASGIVIDNTVVAGSLTTSQIYFSTLANGTCATSGGTGGCAVQATQKGLQ